MIIARYLTKEVTVTFLTILSILLFVMLSNRFVMFLGKAITGELPLLLVSKIVVLYIPELLSFLLPLSILLAILFAYGRLYADHEMIVLSAFGVAPSKLLQITSRGVWIVTGVTLVLTLVIIPWSVKYREQILLEGETRGVMHSLVPGRFHVVENGRRVFYIDKASTNKEKLEGIFIAEQPLNLASKEDPWTVLSAERASLEKDNKTGAFYLTLHSGYRYKGVPGALNYLVAKFEEYGRIIEYLIPTPPDSVKVKPTRELWHTDNQEEIAEWQWLLAFPISIPILALFAFSFSRISPRQGRFVRFFSGVLLYLVYYNLLILFKRWVAHGWIPNVLGLWVLHVAMGYCAYYAFKNEFQSNQI